MAGSSVYVGHLTQNMFSLAGKMISFPSGQLLNQPSLLDVKDISHGLQPYALIRGGAMIEIIVSVASVKTVDFYYGTLALGCCIDRKQ
jgi:hypothetical protein